MNNSRFAVRRSKLVLRATNEIISENEPIFILRGIDTQALSTLRVYQSTMRPHGEDALWKGLQEVIKNFEKFREAHPSLMKSAEEAYY